MHQVVVKKERCCCWAVLNSWSQAESKQLVTLENLAWPGLLGSRAANHTHTHTTHTHTHTRTHIHTHTHTHTYTHTHIHTYTHTSCTSMHAWVFERFSASKQAIHMHRGYTKCAGKKCWQALDMLRAKNMAGVQQCAVVQQCMWKRTGRSECARGCWSDKD